MKNVYIGFDSRQPLAYDVARKSIMARSSGVEVLPLILREPPVSALLTRPVEERGNTLWCPISQAPMATEFAISRFCVPFIQREGWAVFMDCDIVCLTDINELFALADERYAVMVVKHSHIPSETVKMDGQIQTAYARKNWSSVVIWNVSHPANTRLTKKELNGWPGRDLHAFKWLVDSEIGEIPSGWNHLVGIDAPRNDASLLHFTDGGPWLKDWKGGPLDEVWLNEANL